MTCVIDGLKRALQWGEKLLRREQEEKMKIASIDNSLMNFDYKREEKD